MVAESLPIRGAWIEIGGRRALLLRVSSLPIRGAWIEISTPEEQLKTGMWSLPIRGAWIEIILPLIITLGAQSLPIRGAWIEIIGCVASDYGCRVAPHTGSVD